MARCRKHTKQGIDKHAECTMVPLSSGGGGGGSDSPPPAPTRVFLDTVASAPNMCQEVEQVLGFRRVPVAPLGGHTVASSLTLGHWQSWSCVDRLIRFQKTYSESLN